MAVRNLPDDTTNGIAALNVNLASGAISFPGPTQVYNKETGVMHQLSGLGTSAQFVAGGSGAGGYTDAQALAAAQAGIPASTLTQTEVPRVQLASQQMTVADPRRLLRWRRALSRSRSGAASAKILLTGTSSAAGAWANGSANLGPNSRRLGPAPKLAQKLTARGYCVAQAESMLGQQGVVGTGAPTYDPRYAYPVAGWAQSANTNPIGFALTSVTSGATVAFTPASAVDSFEVWYGGTGTASASVDGGAAVTMTPTAANAMAKVTVPAGAAGTHTLSVLKGDSVAVFIYAIRAVNASANNVEIIQGGWPGKRSDSFIPDTLAISPLSQIASAAADLVIYWIGSNDWNSIGGPVTLPELLANIKTVGDRVTSGGGSFLVCANQPTAIDYSAEAASLAKQQQWVAAMREQADANGWAFYPGFYRHNSQEESFANGLYGDKLHLNQFGYDDWVEHLVDFVGA